MTDYLWRFLLPGYLVTIVIETAVLLVALSRSHPIRRRLFAGVWLTACTYPIVVLVLPAVFLGSPRWQYLVVAETFAPAAECVLFWLAFRQDRIWTRSEWTGAFAAIVIANLASFGAGEVLNYYQWFGLF